MFHQRLSAYATVLMLLCLVAMTTTALAENLPVNNGQLLPSRYVHGQAQMPSGWTRADDAGDQPRAWLLPGSAGWAMDLPANAAVQQQLNVPALAEGRDAAQWYALVSVDIVGLTDATQQDRGTLAMEIYDPQTGDAIAHTAADITHRAPAAAMADWRITASSENLGSGNNHNPIFNAFDGNRSTMWHSRWEGQRDNMPHRVTVDFGRNRPVSAITYLPRQDNSNNGTIIEYAVYISRNGEAWGQPIVTGSFDEQTPRSEVRTINLPRGVNTRYIALEARRSMNDAPYASAGMIDFLPAAEEPQQLNDVQRAWLYLTPQQLTPYREGRIGLRLQNRGEHSLAVQQVRFTQLHVSPNRRLMGRQNGGRGPDLLAAGAYGFDALMEDYQHVLTVMAVRDDTPAAEAGLRRGDAIVAVNGRPLPINICAPGWEWLNHGHEATLGHAVIDSFRADRTPQTRGRVTMTVLREGEAHDLTFRLRHPAMFSDRFPLRDEATTAMLRDMYAQLAASQRDNGEWGGFIRTNLAGLALLSSRDPQYAPNIKRAVDWVLNRYPHPLAFDGFAHWPCAYSTTFIMEYYLATGDQRVRGWLEDCLQYVAATHHTTSWGIPALGHDPRGLPYGQKSLVAPTVHLLLFETLAEKVGIEPQLFDLVEPYMLHSWSDPADGGHGALGYNASFKDLDEFWFRTGLWGLVYHLRGERPDIVRASANIMHQRFPWFRNAHAYGEPGGGWGLLALARIDPDAYTDVMRQLRWSFALAWEPGVGLRYSSPHMGAPYMEGDELINAIYAMVFTAPEASLSMSGAEDRNWLDVSHLPTPVSPVRGYRHLNGMVHLHAHLTGNNIHYRLDGRDPTPNDPVYNRPFMLARPGTITARTFNINGEAGPVMRLDLGLPKARWRVVDASGHSDPQQAIARAGRAINGLPHVSWLTDAGHEQSGYPHHVTIDMGELRRIGMVGMHFGEQHGTPTRWRLSTSINGRDWQQAAEGEWPDYRNHRNIELPAMTRTRFIRFEALEGRNPMLMQIAEIEIFPATTTTD